MSKVKILLADDHTMLRQGIRVLLDREPDFKVVAEAGDGVDAVRLCGEYKPDVVLMDVGMPLLGGLEATRQIKDICPDTAVLVLTIHDDEEYIIGFLEAGAVGYLMKNAYGEELSQAIRSIVAGDMVLHPMVGQKLLKCATNRQLNSVKTEVAEQLTPREVEVLRMVGKGTSNREIALKLGVSTRTVKGHLVNIFSKMKVHSRTEATLSALKRGLITMEEMI
ncbi:response regulator [Chloroflexota bacterium]